MQITKSDLQSIAEVQSVAFSMFLPGLAPAYVTMTNEGVNTINYDFQQNNGTAFVDMGLPGSPTYNTIMPGQTVNVVIAPSYPQVQLLANASGGALLFFTVNVNTVRTSGGPI